MLMGAKMDNYLTLIQKACGNPDLVSSTQFLYALYMVGFISFLPNVLLAIITIKVKSSQDIL